MINQGEYIFKSFTAPDNWDERVRYYLQLQPEEVLSIGNWFTHVISPSEETISKVNKKWEQKLLRDLIEKEVENGD